MAAGALLMMGSAPTALAAVPDGGPGDPSGCIGCTNGVTALMVGGQGSYATLTEEQMSTAFGGYFANYDQRISSPFPGDADFAESIPVGATNLYNAVYEQPAGTILTIGGVSKGAPSVLEALKRLEADRENLTDGLTPPSPEHMNVMIYGAPSRMYYAGVRYRPDLPVTPYDIVLVTAEYDGIADMPDNMFNILAVLNAIRGADMLHVDAAFNTDFANDPMRYKVEVNKDGGKITTVVIPYTGTILPLLHPMLEAGSDPAFLTKLSAFLKPIIDSGYKRNGYFEKPKWTTGVVDLPLPEAANPVTPLVQKKDQRVAINEGQSVVTDDDPDDVVKTRNKVVKDDDEVVEDADKDDTIHEDVEDVDDVDDVDNEVQDDQQDEAESAPEAPEADNSPPQADDGPAGE